MENANDVVKMVYTQTRFDVDAMCAHTRYVYEIFPDGTVIRKHYEKGVRKAIDKEESKIASAAEYHLLCLRLNSCISSADREEIYIDDSSAELRLYHPFGRSEIMPRGFGNGKETVGELICKYVFDKAKLDI